MDDRLLEIGAAAKKAAGELACLGASEKNAVLSAVAAALVRGEEALLLANAKDIAAAKEKGVKASLIDRLTLTKSRIADMAEGLLKLTALTDPIGQTVDGWRRPNGLEIQRRTVPLGVVGIIYESRPNVTADAFGLCFKSGNAVILKGGSDALCSNQAITALIREVLEKIGVDKNSIQLIESTDREVTRRFMRMNQYVDVLIPRGGAGLIRTVVENSTVPVIETGTGNCHIYVDDAANIDMAADIIFNAKTQRLGVCNACESLVIHEAVIDRALPVIAKKLSAKNVELRGDERAMAAEPLVSAASESDWGTEYLDAIISVKTVRSVDEAIAHINKYNTKHSEAIITENYANARKFLDKVDAAAVYVNASTRFTDGFEFGFGAEIGISTQKLHARGPMGLGALTTTKYVIYGDGQVRP